MIYLDHNATTPLRPEVLEAMQPYLTAHWGNPSSPYRAGAGARTAVEEARRQLAGAVGFASGEVIFTSGGTEADNLAIRGVARALRTRGRHLVTSAVEHPAVLATCRDLEADGWQVTVLPVDGRGVIDLEALERSIGPETVLVSIMDANNETGVLQPLEEIAAITRAHGVALHTDAVQTAGKDPARLGRLGAQLISISGHKLYGPKGTGALLVRRGTQLHAVVTGGGQEGGLRAGTENVAGIVGLARAVVAAEEEAPSEGPRLRALRDRLERRVLAALPGTRVNGAGAPRTPGTSSLCFDAVDGESVVLALDLQGICASTGSACSTGAPEPSHVLRAMGCSPREAQGSVRFSLGLQTLEADVDATVDVLVNSVGRLRAISSIADGTG